MRKYILTILVLLLLTSLSWGESNRGRGYVDDSTGTTTSVTVLSSSRVVTAAELEGGTIRVDPGNFTATLPNCGSAEVGNLVTFSVRDTADTLSIAPDTGDTIRVNGLSLAASDELDSNDDGFESITLICVQATLWMGTAVTGTWVDGTP